MMPAPPITKPGLNDTLPPSSSSMGATEPDLDPVPPAARSINATLKWDAAEVAKLRADAATSPSAQASAAPSVPPPANGTIKLSPEEMARLAPSPRHAGPRTATMSAMAAPMPANATTIARPGAPPVARGGEKRALMQPRVMIATGLAVLLLLSVASYMTVQILVASNRTWVAPTVLSVSDPRVVQVTALLQQESQRKSELVLHKKELESRLKDARRWVQIEESFQASYKAALRSDLEGQMVELKRTQFLLAAATSVDEQTPERQPNELRSGELEARVTMLKQRMRALETALRNERAVSPGYNAIASRRQVDLSLLAADKARELIDALTKALAETDQVLAEKEALLKSIESSPYRLAAKSDVVLGFLPYENVSTHKKGDPLFACKTSLLFCRKVGTAEDVLAGEVRAPHPMLGHELRGQLVKISLEDQNALARPMLFAVRPPLGI